MLAFLNGDSGPFIGPETVGIGLLSGGKTGESGWIYILHCFTKKTNETSLGDITCKKTTDNRKETG